MNTTIKALSNLLHENMEPQVRERIMGEGRYVQTEGFDRHTNEFLGQPHEVIHQKLLAKGVEP